MCMQIPIVYFVITKFSWEKFNPWKLPSHDGRLHLLKWIKDKPFKPSTKCEEICPYIFSTCRNCVLFSCCKSQEQKRFHHVTPTETWSRAGKCLLTLQVNALSLAIFFLQLRCSHSDLKNKWKHLSLIWIDLLRLRGRGPQRLIRLCLSTGQKKHTNTFVILAFCLIFVVSH